MPARVLAANDRVELVVRGTLELALAGDEQHQYEGAGLLLIDSCRVRKSAVFIPASGDTDDYWIQTDAW